eukprot:Sdes_comp15168_c0_seq1m3987
MESVEENHNEGKENPWDGSLFQHKLGNISTVLTLAIKNQWSPEVIDQCSRVKPFDGDEYILDTCKIAYFHELIRVTEKLLNIQLEKYTQTEQHSFCELLFHQELVKKKEMMDSWNSYLQQLLENLTHVVNRIQLPLRNDENCSTLHIHRDYHQVICALVPCITKFIENFTEFEQISKWSQEISRKSSGPPKIKQILEKDPRFNFPSSLLAQYQNYLKELVSFRNLLPKVL